MYLMMLTLTKFNRKKEIEDKKMRKITNTAVSIIGIMNLFLRIFIFYIIFFKRIIPFLLRKNMRWNNYCSF